MEISKSDERKRLLNRAYTRIYVSMCEIHNILKLEDNELENADRHTRAAAMRALRIESPYRFGRLCQQRGIPEDRKWFTTQDIFDLSADYQLYKIFQSLPEEKLSLLEKLLRETIPDAFPKK